MSLEKIIREAINKNPLCLKEALEEELRVRVALVLESKKIIKDLGQGIKVAIESDGSIVIADRTAPGGQQLVVLEANQVKEMLSIVKTNRPVRGHNLGAGVKFTFDADGSAVISDSSAPGGRQMVVL